MSEVATVEGMARRYSPPGVIIGAVEAVLAIAFAAFVFGGYLASRLADGIGLYLVAAVLTLGILAWRAGSRGVVGSVQDAAVAVLAASSRRLPRRRRRASRWSPRRTGVGTYEPPDVFLTVIAATLVVTILCGVVFAMLGTFRLGNLVRFVPYPVVGGFLAGTGWLLFKGGIYVASGVQPHLRTFDDSCASTELLSMGARAFAFGADACCSPVRLREDSRWSSRSVLGIGLVVFAVGMLVTGSSIDSAKDGAVVARALRVGPAVAARGRSARSAAPTGRRCSRSGRRHRRRPCSWRRSRSCSTSAGPRSCCTGT